jgi:hypothetical protein
MDLNLDHYSLTELLKLFKLRENFTASEFKEAKKIVHALHPDKWTSSNQEDKIKYYLFFTNAYKLLESVNQFKHKIEENIDAHLSFDQIIDDMADSDKQQIINSLSSNPNFNKDFNALFDTYYIKEEENGYGDWLKSNDDLNVSYEDRKKHSRAIVVNQIECSPQDTYSDLKNAYTINSVLGVSEEDYTQQYKNVQHLKQVRDTQNLTPLNKESATQYFANQEEEDKKLATERAFRFVKQTEQNKIQQKSFWSHLLTLKNE